MRVLTTVILVASCVLPPSLAQTRPDFSGVWFLDGWSTDVWPAELPYTDKGKEAQRVWAEAPENDPTHQCVFQLVRITSAPFPHELIQQDERVTILYENEHQVRRVFMDGRSHPDDSYPTLMGHSTGFWEGDSLVIDTVGVEAGYLRPQGYPHSDQIHVIEKRTLLEDGAKKRMEMTIIDSEYFYEPINLVYTYSRSQEDIQEYECEVREHLPAPSPDP